MSLAESNLALGAVTRLLTNRLGLFTNNVQVTATRPEHAATTGTNPKLNIFLYETIFDASLRNVSLDPGRPAPLWLVLKYILTAFDGGGDSDTPDAHELLGRGMSALQQLAYLPIDSASPLAALQKNPEPLKITFDEVTADVISKLMQGGDENYRLSVGFQVRPVMIAPPEPASYSLLVGIDYTKTPAEPRPDGSRFIDVLPSLGISLDAVTPPSFELNSSISIIGTDLNLSGVEVLLGSSPLTILPPVTSAKLDCQVTTGPMSAGSYPLLARQTLSPGRFRSSNLLVGNLLPTVTTASVPAAGTLRIAGQLLGTGSDDVVVAFYRNGAVERMFDEVLVIDPGQTQLDLTISPTVVLPPDTYRIILRVNGQQARNSPAVTWP
jgi:hypothetical protein